jgi:hypothetical protein
MKETCIILTSNDIVGLLAVAMILRLALDKLQSAVAIVAVAAVSSSSSSSSFYHFTPRLQALHNQHHYHTT